MIYLEERVADGDKPLHCHANGQQDRASQANMGCRQKECNGMGEGVTCSNVGYDEWKREDEKGTGKVDKVEAGKSNHEPEQQSKILFFCYEGFHIKFMKNAKAALTNET